jgi:CBS domain-containing protein
MKAKDVMTRPVVLIGPEASVTDAVQLMLKNAISGLPVVDTKGELVGIVTEGDFLRRKETGTERARPRWLEYLVGPGRLAADYVHAAGRKVGDVMTREVRTVAEGAPLKEVVELIERHRIKRVPVVSGGKVVGIVSRANLLQALASVAGELKPGAAGDENIRERLLEELEKQSWVPLPLLNFIRRAPTQGVDRRG